MQGDPNYGRQEEESRLRRVSIDKDDPYGGGGSPFGGAGGSMGTMGSSGTMSAQDERTWSMLAHLSVLAWFFLGLVSLFLLVTVVLMPAVPLVLWLVFKDRSPRVAFHALQSFWYQAAWTAILVVAVILAFILILVLTVVTLGIGAFLFFLIPLVLVLGLIPLAHQIYAAYKVNQGVDYRYPIIADMVDGGRRFG